MIRKEAQYAVLAVVVLTLVSIPLLSPESEGYTDTVLSDGTSYTYETYGNDYSTYRATIIRGSSDEPVLYISTVLEGYNVTEISAGAFSGCTAVTAAVVPEKVKTIGAGAFSGCTSLESVYFLGDAPSVASNAFPAGVKFYRTEGSSGWSKYITSVIEQYDLASDDGSVTTYYVIGNEAMVSRGSPSPEGLVTILPAAGGYPVTSIGPYSFSGTSNTAGTDVVPRSDIMSVIIPEGVAVIRERAFYYNAGLMTVSLPQSLTSVMDEAFRAASSMGTVDMPGNLRYIGFESFRQCSSMKMISIPDSTLFIGEGAFKICTDAESIVIGENITKIAPWAFAYCRSATSIELRGNVKEIESSAFYLCDSLVKMSLPDTLTSLGSSAFFGCESLERLSLGKSLILIGSGAFSECPLLNKVCIPDTVLSISSKAFAYCSGMTDIYFEGNMPELGYSVFLNTDAVVHIKESNKNSWNGFDGELAIDKSSDGFPLIPVFAVALAVLTIAAVIVVRHITK
ncbi:MAG: leucine-rich repeat domain-containing protein [Methanomassiliicoccaceae archaeon]|nr:leucine-rich repeat domain-containing protein [Methanomassiliicoccaceae archaeon]